MILFKKAVDLTRWRHAQRETSVPVAFVPTMGALHAGHLRLVAAAQAVCRQTVCSIFVNPTQFNDPRDYEKYPVSTGEDIAALERAGNSVLFLPAVSEVYPGGTKTETYPLGELEQSGEGAFRPGHFQGVAQVMDRLLGLVAPDHLFMGQKDFQQCLVVQALIRYRGLPVVFHTVPTVREPDGLAMSSRNRRLDARQRLAAPALAETLDYIRETLAAGPVEPLVEEGKRRLTAAGLRPDYLIIARAGDASPLTQWNGREKAVVLAAVFLGEVRLIDNMLIN